jgi:integrase
MSARDDKTTTKKATAGRIYRALSDGHVSALRDFDLLSIVWDRKVPGLRVRVGQHRATWSYFREHRIHGRRSTTCKTLGHFPEMSTAAARQAALVEAGKVAAGRVEPGKRAALRLGPALNEYMKHLHGKATRKGKPARHAANVEKLRRQFLAEFETWPLADLSHNPAIVRDWHEKITREAGPISANRAAEVLRACYRHAARLDRSLPPALPTSAVSFNPETPSQAGLGQKQFSAWASIWNAIPGPVQRAYALCQLLTGCRPGELATLKRADILPAERVFILRNAKAGDVRVILSRPITAALRMALDAHRCELVFPGCAQVAHRLGLPATGAGARRTYRTVALGHTDELLCHLLMSHSPQGISARYINRMAAMQLPAMRAAQRKISADLMRRLGLKLDALRSGLQTT